MLMISAMFMIASCGGNSNSNETSSEEKTEEESVEEVEFSDPAIVFEEGIDLTSYFSAESVSQPTIYKESNQQEYRLSTNVKLKLIKKLDLVATSEQLSAVVYFEFKFLDKGGSSIAKSYHYSKYLNSDHLNEMQVGTIMNFDVKSTENEMFESQMQELLNKVEKIEVCISTAYIGFKTEE